MHQFASLASVDKDGNIIKCPICGQEYLPAEIFLPEELLGKPKDIVKTTDGKIDFFLGERPTLETTYNCDNCFTTFKVRAKIAYDVFVEQKDNFDNTYVSKLKTNIKQAEEVNLFDSNPAEI